MWLHHPQKHKGSRSSSSIRDKKLFRAVDTDLDHFVHKFIAYFAVQDRGHVRFNNIYIGTLKLMFSRLNVL